MTSPRHSQNVRTPISPTSSSGGGLPLSIHDEGHHLRSHRHGANTRSVISSRTTDISDSASDIMGLAEAQQSQSQAVPQVSPRSSARGGPSHTTRTSVADMMDSFSTRPSTAMSNTTSTTHRNWPSISGGNRGLPSSVAGGSTRGRPDSSASRTHAPGVANQAFYRPMSSAKLQAQRGRVTEEFEEEQNRIRSFAKPATYSPSPQLPTNIPIVHHHSSNSVRIGEQHPREVSVSSTVEQTLRTAPSLNSTSPLHEETRQIVGEDNSVRNVNVRRMPQNRNSSSRGGNSSNGSTATAQQQPPNLGKNHEYFPGNMRFCFGGRWQTARDFPMNILTGILVSLPAALFFGYSYVSLPACLCLRLADGYAFLVRIFYGTTSRPHFQSPSRTFSRSP